MPKLLIIADDLTGACDAAATFASKGIPVLVQPDASRSTLKWVDGLQVLAVTTESRHLDPVEAVTRVRSIVAGGIAAGVTNFFKKTDSTMRGNTGSELEALLTTSGESILPLIPAVPQLERTTRRGCQFVANIPLHKTSIAADPIDRIESSYIPEIIASQSQVRVSVIETGQLKEFERSEPRPGICLFDATTDQDLLDIGQALKRRKTLRIVAGAAGFASVVPELLDFARYPIESPQISGRMLVVNGSLNDVSMKQVEWAERNGFAAFTPGPELLITSPANLGKVDEWVAGTLRAAEGRDVVVRSIEHRSDLHRYLEPGKQLGLGPGEVHLRVAENLGKIVSRMMRGTGFKVIAVFGGDTLAAIVRSFGWSGLWPRAEITQGFVVLEVDPDRDILLLTKAGAFGREDILGRIR